MSGTHPSATSRSTTRSAAQPGWKHYFIGGETPPLSALVVDRARGWPALSPPLLAARAFREALVRRGVTVVGRPGLGIAPLAADDARLGRLRPARGDRPPHEPRERQLLRRDAAQAAPGGGGEGRARPRAAARIVIAAMREAGIPVEGVRMVDGSGLSSLDRLTADALVGVIGGGRARTRRSGRVRRLARRRRCERNAQPPPAVAPRPGEGQDGHDRPRLHAVGPDPQRRSCSRCSRTAAPSPRGRRGGPGPLRHDPRLGNTCALAAARGFSLSPGLRGSGKQRLQVGLGEDRHAGLLGLRGLRARALADDDAGRLLRDGVRDLRAERLERCPAPPRGCSPRACPVITYCFPVSGPSGGSSSSRTSSSGQSSATSAWFASSANHSTIASARSGPIPSHAITSSGVAAREPLDRPEMPRERLRRDPARRPGC